MRWILLIWLLLTLAGPCWNYFTNKADLKADYRTASRESAHIAPAPSKVHEAVIQVYSARAFNWRGLIASHCWISIKPKDASTYTVYQVIGWLNYRGLPALSIAHDLPDRKWYNAMPHLVLDVRGARAEKFIPRIEDAARMYPYAYPYTLWPGPNSNTFPAYIGRLVPELGMALPADAIGKDFLMGNNFFAQAPSGTGYQLSIFGALGLLIAQKEGIELNLLGLVYGVKFSPFTILLPGL